MSTKDYILPRKKCQSDILELGKGKKQRINRVLQCGNGYLTEGTLDRMGCCRNYWELVANVTLEKKKTTGGNSCKSVWCPVCAWLQARKDALKISVLMKYIQDKEGKEFLFLTLTAPNVRGDRLGETITKYNKAFKKLTERQEVERVVEGYIRKLEVTYNKEEYITKDMWYGNRKRRIKARGKYFQSLGLRVGDRNPNYDTYHPHFHVLIAVNKSYFTDTRYYIKHETWLALWRDVMGDKTITQVDVRKVRMNEGKEIGEVAKYTAKDGDYTVSPDVFGVFYKALKGRQRTTYSGLFAEANKKFKNGDEEMEKYKEKDLTDYVYRLFYTWGKEKGEYLLTDCRELTERERAEIHGIPWEEMEIEE